MITNSPSFKIALVHDYLKEYGGAESVLETLSDIFPDAEIFTSLYCPQNFGPHRARLEKKWSHRVHQSFFQHLPFAKKLISPLRMFSPLAFKFFNFTNFDLIITSATGAYFPNALNKQKARLVCYCHTPPRYLYGLPTARQFGNYPVLSQIISLINYFLRQLDFQFSKNVDQYLANSSTTASRIKKFYGRDSIVINPPVDIPNVGATLADAQKTGGFLTGGRLARAKRYDIAIQACNLLKLPLKVFGRDFAGFESELKAMAGDTVEFLGEVTQEEKTKLLSQAQAFIFCSDNEDFGIAPVEAMAVGTPVIAYRSGGTTETVIDGKTGIFFDKLTPKSCAAAIQKLRAEFIRRGGLAKAHLRQDCISRAQDFSKEKFVEKIKKLILS